MNRLAPLSAPPSPPPGVDTPFSAIVVVYNDETNLAGCLSTLEFCDEILVVDLGSTDGSRKVAERAGARVIGHPHRSIVEQVHREVAGLATHDWLILVDPDERMPEGIEADIRRLIQQDDSIGLVGLPWRFHFKGEPLDTTIWGVPKFKAVVRHRERVEFVAEVHNGWRMRPGFTHVAVPAATGRSVKHLWMSSYRDLASRHLRYVRAEGEARYAAGERFNWLGQIRHPLGALRLNLFRYSGLRGGVRGIFLSFFHAAYVALSINSLRRYERRRRIDV